MSHIHAQRDTIFFYYATLGLHFILSIPPKCKNTSSMKSECYWPLHAIQFALVIVIDHYMQENTLIHISYHIS